MIFWTKFSDNVSNLILKGLCKIQVDIPIYARVTSVQSLENLQTFLYVAAVIMVGKKVNAHQPIFPYNIIENSPTSLAHNSVFIGPNNFKIGTQTR